MEWETEEPMPRWRGRFQVWVRGQVREVLRQPVEGLIYTDCRHPAQNRICDESRVEGWRLVEEK